MILKLFFPSREHFIFQINTSINYQIMITDAKPLPSHGTSKWVKITSTLRLGSVIKYTPQTFSSSVDEL